MIGWTNRGSPVALAGCGIWLFFTVIFGILAERSWKQEQEARITITSGSGISCSHRAGMRNTQREQSRIRDIIS